MPTSRKPMRPRLEVRRDSDVWGSFDWNDDLVLFDNRIVKRKRDVVRLRKFLERCETYMSKRKARGG